MVLASENQLRSWWITMGFDPARFGAFSSWHAKNSCRLNRRASLAKVIAVYAYVKWVNLHRGKHSSTGDASFTEFDSITLKIIIGDCKAYRLICSGEYDNDLEAIMKSSPEKATFRCRGESVDSKLCSLLILHAETTAMQTPEKFRFAWPTH